MLLPIWSNEKYKRYLFLIKKSKTFEKQPFDVILNKYPQLNTNIYKTMIFFRVHIYIIFKIINPEQTIIFFKRLREDWKLTSFSPTHETSPTPNPASQTNSLYTIYPITGSKIVTMHRTRRSPLSISPWMNFWTVRPRTHRKSYITSPVRCWRRSQPDDTGLVMPASSKVRCWSYNGVPCFSILRWFWVNPIISRRWGLIKHLWYFEICITHIINSRSWRE